MTFRFSFLSEATIKDIIYSGMTENFIFFHNWKNMKVEILQQEGAPPFFSNLELL
jgi:hypothetical protein